MKLHLKKGALHKSLGVNPKKKIPHDELVMAAHSPNKLLAKRARFALIASKWKH
jgi:hypothetical protein